MKILTYIRFQKSQLKDHRIYDDILKIHPGDEDGDGFFCATLEKESPALIKIVQKLKEASLKPWINQHRPRLPDDYVIVNEVKYERKDYLKSLYLGWFPNHSLADVAQTTAEAKIILNLDEFEMAEVEPRTRKALFAGSLHLAVEKEETLVSTTFRNTIEQAGLIGIIFEDRVQLIGELAAKVPEKYWVLRSSLVMPALSKKTHWINELGEPCEMDVPHSHLPLGELCRYDASALAPMEPFDLALVIECKPPQHETLMSQRFYQLCLKHKIQLIVEPIEVMPS